MTDGRDQLSARGHVAIVGAGITGLVAARALARRGWRVEVYERWPDVGGMASAFDVGDGVWIERYYHHLFESDELMIRLHDELLPGQLEWHPSTVGIFARGRLWPFTSPWDLLRYGPLSPLERLRLGLAVLRLQRRTDWSAMDDVRALDWARRACGDRVVEQVWRPLLLGKFGDAADDVPLAWLWSKIALRRRLRGQGIGREQLGYPRGSFRAICVALADDAKRHGAQMLLDQEVLGVTRTESGGYELRCAAPGAFRRSALVAAAEPARRGTAEAVLVTTPAFIARDLIDGPDRLRAQLGEWRYRTAVVLLLELRRPLTTTYWVNVADPRVAALGIVEHTNLVPASRYRARYVYVSNYVDRQDPIVSLSTDELVALHAPGLSLVSPGFTRRDVVRAWSFREQGAQPVPSTPARGRIMPIETEVPGLFLANTTQIYPEDRGTNYSARLGEDAAAVIDRRPRY